MRKILDALIFIFNPNWHTMLGKYDKVWDKEFNRLLANYKFTDIGSYTANLNGITLWIENYPYGCFEENLSHRNEPTGDRIRPSKFTIIKAMRKLKNDKLYHNLIQTKINSELLEDGIREYLYDFTDNGFKFIPGRVISLESKTPTNTIEFTLRLNEKNRIHYKINPHTIMDDYFTMVDRLKDNYNILSHKMEFHDNEIDIVILLRFYWNFTKKHVKFCK